MGGKQYAANIVSIREAKERISSYIHTTPLTSSATLNNISGRNLYFKCECFQKCGAFKIRGACNAVFSLTDDQAAKGVVTHSSGNHAAALSYAAGLRGIPAHVVVPNSAPTCKLENIIRYGGIVHYSEPTPKSREATAAKVQHDTDAVLIPSSNDGRIMSGQGTIALELLEQAPNIDTIIAPISGGGLISGLAIAAKSINPRIKILAAEPKGADDAARSKKAGEIVTLNETKTIADGLRSNLGNHTWPVVRDLVDDIIVVDDEEILQAMKLCYKVLKLSVEPSGAIGLAVALSEKFRENPKFEDSKNIGIIISGGNLDLDVLWTDLSNKFIN